MLWPGGGTVTVSAQFGRAVGLYEGSDVRILGVKVGEVNKVEPQGETVRVEFTYADKYKVPQDAKAVVVAPSVVSDRYVQLTPVYESGPAMEEADEIPAERTAVPVELDQIFTSLNDLNVGLGPKGANKEGALSRLLEVGADNLDGQGANINQTVARLLARPSPPWPTARRTCSAPSGTCRSSPPRWPRTTERCAPFNQDLASVADQLAGRA